MREFTHTLTGVVGTAGFHRAQFLDVLAAHLDQRVEIHFSKRLVSYSDAAGSPVRMVFADGSSASADVLIACDGIHSIVRRQLLKEAAVKCENAGSKEDILLAERMRASIEPVWTGWIVYRSVVQSKKFAERCPNTQMLTRPLYVSLSLRASNVVYAHLFYFLNSLMGRTRQVLQ